MKKTLTDLWEMVNSVDTSTTKALPKLWEAEEAIQKADNISIEDFDELMMTVAYLYREFYRYNK